jgi:hypothetical protein
MICPNCLRLALLTANRKCMRCQGDVFNNLSVICDGCSDKDRQCSVCLKKIVPPANRNKSQGCGCGSKK